MIDWDKPIETMDGRKAKLLSCVMPEGGDYSSGRAVYVSPPPGAVFGDVFLVDEEGFRCDNAVGIHRPQIIRNVRVKREGWMAIYRGKIRDGVNNSSPLYDTLEECMTVCAGNKVAAYARVEWEEYP